MTTGLKMLVGVIYLVEFFALSFLLRSLRKSVWVNSDIYVKKRVQKKWEVRAVPSAPSPPRWQAGATQKRNLWYTKREKDRYRKKDKIWGRGKEVLQIEALPLCSWVTRVPH
jgi:hypothetical protein